MLSVDDKIFVISVLKRYKHCSEEIELETPLDILAHYSYLTNCTWGMEKITAEDMLLDELWEIIGDTEICVLPRWVKSLIKRIKNV